MPPAELGKGEQALKGHQQGRRMLHGQPEHAIVIDADKGKGLDNLPRGSRRLAQHDLQGRKLLVEGQGKVRILGGAPG